MAGARRPAAPPLPPRHGAPRFHHFAIDVDDFEQTYLEARRRGLLEDRPFGAAVRELPDGSAQMYIRDPAGNLVEIDTPDASTLDRSVVGEIPRIADTVGATETQGSATLYHDRE